MDKQAEANNLYLRELALSLGADLCGFADLRPHQAAIEEQYGAAWRDYPYAVSLAVFLPRDVVRQMLDFPVHAYQRYYDAANARLDDIGLRLATRIESLGYRAYPIPASQRQGEHRLAAVFSHRLAANVAGLGAPGKSCSILTPERGPLQRFCTVLTDMPIAGGTMLPSPCGACHACVDICPLGALKGVLWQDEPDIAARFDAAACNEQLLASKKNFGIQVCAKCIAVCPKGRGRIEPPPAPQAGQLLFWIERDISALLPSRRLAAYTTAYLPLAGGLIESLRRLALGARVGVTLWPCGFAGHMEQGYVAAAERAVAAGLEGELEKNEVEYAIIGCFTDGAGISVSGK